MWHSFIDMPSFYVCNRVTALTKFMLLVNRCFIRRAQPFRIIYVGPVHNTRALDCIRGSTLPWYLSNHSLYFVKILNKNLLKVIIIWLMCLRYKTSVCVGVLHCKRKAPVDIFHALPAYSNERIAFMQYSWVNKISMHIVNGSSAHGRHDIKL